MEQDFIFYEKKEDCRNLILFVHGFTGDVESTWKNKNGNSFPELLLQNSHIKDNFDVASYSYFSTLLGLFAVKSTYRKVTNYIFGKTKANEKNLDIEELASNLRNHIRFTLGQYDNIYVIAHSMGGLITKSLIVGDLIKDGITKVKLFLSLAVPHQGAELSVIGGLISSNLQIKNLNPVEEFINTLNQQWINLEKPTTKYYYGSYDTVVTKHSAVALDKYKKDIVSVKEDHNTISKPSDSTSILINSTLQFLTDAHKNTVLHDTGFQNLPKEEQLNEELFVIKLFAADISEESQVRAKELFFNAEYVRKLFNSRHDIKQIQELFDSIRQLYKDSYDWYLTKDIITSQELLADVHKKITDKDSCLLKSLIPTLKFYHKQGMLHQLANDKNSDIWWSQNRDLTAKE
jgi:hypothetical protein